MKKIFSALPLLLLAPPASATDLSFEAIAGGSIQLQGEIGYGNWLTPTLYEQNVQGISSDERLLESFSFLVSGVGSLTYRTAVGVLDGTALAYDAYSTDWRTTTDGGVLETVIPSGLILDPSLQYVLYMQPAGALGDAIPWSIETTLTNRYIGVVGAAPQFYTASDQVDLDLANDRDVAMTARITAVPEPSIFLLLLAGGALFVVKSR